MTRQFGFTLVELLVVIAIIALLLAIVLPSAAAFFSSGSESSARNLVSAQLSAARGIAIRDRQITGVHFQPHESKPEIWMAIVQLKADSGKFDLAPGTTPVALPSGIAVGEISGNYVDVDKYDEGKSYDIRFNTFTVVFDVDGRLKLENVVFPDADESLLFGAQGATKLWDRPNDEDSVKSLCLYEAAQVELRATDTEKATWLNENARFLPVNPYAGGLIRSGNE